MSASPWPALLQARTCDGPPRVPFLLADAAGGAPGIVLGSVALAQVDVLRAWPDAFAVLQGDASPVPRAVALILPAPERDARLAAIHAQLHASGLIRGWRSETYPLRDRDGGEHGRIERAAARFWGSLTFGAHCNGYVAGPDGRPTHLWIARRSHTKPTDPGRLDNLVGGGVPLGQTPREAVIREGYEEAGLEPAQMAGLVEGGIFELDCDVPEGRQHERLFVHDLALPAGRVPRDLDGEVAEHRRMPIAEALARAAAGELTTDAALATFDFALRHGFIARSPSRPVEPFDAGPESTAIGALDAAQWRAYDALRAPSPCPILGESASALPFKATEARHQ